jgi:hypothetical protein
MALQTLIFDSFIAIPLNQRHAFPSIGVKKRAQGKSLKDGGDKRK